MTVSEGERWLSADGTCPTTALQNDCMMLFPLSSSLEWLYFGFFVLRFTLFKLLLGINYPWGYLNQNYYLQLYVVGILSIWTFKWLCLNYFIALRVLTCIDAIRLFFFCFMVFALVTIFFYWQLKIVKNCVIKHFLVAFSPHKLLPLHGLPPQTKYPKCVPLI